MDTTSEVLVGDGVDRKLPAEAFEWFVLCDGEIDVAGAESELDRALVLNLVLEVGEAADEVVNLG